MPTTPYTSVSAILTLQCAKCGFYQKTTNPAIANLLAAKHQAGWGSAHAVTTTGASFLDFTTGTLPPGVTFTRASTGTYNNSSNILATAGVNVARFNYVAGVANLLIEPSATNLLSQSNGFGTAPWAVYSGGVLTAAQFISPDGSNNGWSLNNPAGFGGRNQFPINFSVVPYTFSIWSKFISGTDPVLFKLIGGATPSSGTAAALTRGFAVMTPSAAGNDTAYIQMSPSATNGTDGIYGAQLELGSVMTSYIPTTTAAATRAIDQATFTIPAGVTQLKYTFDDNSTQTVSVSPGSYTIPATLNRANIKTIDTISGSASINFDFTTGVLPGAITFTRPSIGTYTSSGNLLVTAGNDVARFNYVAGVSNLLIEGSATNLWVSSNNFLDAANWYTTSSSLVAAAFACPDGSTNGWSMASAPGNGAMGQFPSGGFSHIPYTTSIWVKRITGTAPIQIISNDATSANLTTSATLTRLSATLTPTAGSAGNNVYIIAASGSTNGFFGGQVESGSTPTSYIPTTTAAVTRAADSAVFTIPAGINTLTYTFDDGSTQVVSVSPGSYTIPVNLNRANIKTIVGSFVPPGVNFDFTTGSLPAGITFTRASIGTYNSSGNILTTASANVARFNYVSGVANLLIEPSATNMFVQSNAFTTTPWTIGSSILTPAQFISPDGTNDGWSFASDWNTSLSMVNTVSNVPYTMSAWLKLITGNAQINFSIYGVQNFVTISTTLARVSATATPPAGTGGGGIQINASPGSVTDGLYGAQFETGSIPTSYIPTTTAAVTRAADSATFTVPAGVNALKYTFDDGSTQVVNVSPGSYTIPTNLQRANIKSIVSTFGFDFTSGSLPAGMTFTRPSIGTYVNNAGTLITAGSNVARFNYVSGVSNLLIEGSATNLFTQSNNFSHADWNAAGNGIVATAAQFISPDGTNDGWSVTSNPVNSTFFEFMTVSNIPYTMSIWAKQITASTGTQFAIKGQFSGPLAITTTLARIVYTATPTAGSGSVNYQILTTTGTQGVYGAQLETGSKTTSYIPTTTAAVTRAADSAVFTIPSGIGHLTYTFDDNSTQLVTVSAGSYTIPVTLNRPNIKSIVGSA